MRGSNVKLNKIFRQFFDKTSSTYTYLLGDLHARTAILIDTVEGQSKRDIRTIEEFGFKTIFLINTHIHADHVTGNAAIKNHIGSGVKSILSSYYKSATSDLKVSDGQCLDIASFRFQFLHTPGHTSGCMTLVDHDNRRLFTGDTLLIRGCGRTDFQDGSSEELYNSVHEKLFKLPRDYLVYPAHDYNGYTCSSIGEEMDFNPRLTRSRSEFCKIMANLNLAYPKMIDIAVPRNLNCGFDGNLNS